MPATLFQSKPVFALVGRPNVGKSTLFNQLTKTRDALVADFSGLTRDRQYGEGRLGDLPFQVIDTGGLAFGETLPSPGVQTKTDHEKFEQLQVFVEQQVSQAISECQVVLVVVDARAGVTPMDETLLKLTRRSGKPFMLVINKTDGLKEGFIITEFAGVGVPETVMVAASHGRGLLTMLEQAHALVPQAYHQEAAALRAELEQAEHFFAGSGVEGEGGKLSPIQFAIVGRPNVGKSTLCNRLLGEDRVVVCDLPGTTRDSVFIPFTAHNKPYVLIDTAGVRRRGKVSQTVEKFSVLKAFKAIECADVVLSVIDANEPFVDQDLHILAHALQANKPVILVVNKWDGVKTDIKLQIKSIINRRLHFLKEVPMQFISALHGTGVGHLYEKIHRCYEAYTLSPATTHLNKILERVLEANPTPMAMGRQIKIRFVSFAGSEPPHIVFHGTQTKRLPESYKKFLLNSFRAALQIPAMPLKMSFKDSENPFKNKKNSLSERQVKKRKRLVKHVKRNNTKKR